MGGTRRSQIALGLFVGLVLVGIVLLRTTASTVEKDAAATEPGLDAVAQAVDLSGDYSGRVQLEQVVRGVYSDTLATPTPVAGSSAAGDLGELDITLRLSQDGSRVSGYVLLEDSLAFPEEHEVSVTRVPPEVAPGAPTPTPATELIKVGPMLSGSYDGTTLELESERFSILLSPTRTLATGQIIPQRLVTRQLRLTSRSVTEEGALLDGEYRETLWGYDLWPSTAIGSFTLRKPVFGVEAPTPGPTSTHTPEGTAGPEETPTPTTEPTEGPSPTPPDPSELDNKIFLPSATIGEP